jgi:ferrous iron transport protein A
MKLNECIEESKYCIVDVEGNKRFIDRVSAMGLTKNTDFQVFQNKKSQPVLLYARNTMIAINRKESVNIIVEEKKI